MARPGAPGALTFRPGLPGKHPYYDLLTRRPDLFAAYALRSQAEIDSYKEAASSSTVRQPIVYDATADAATFTINPPVSSDVKGRYLPFAITGSSFLLTWDFRLDAGFRYKGEGDIRRHKSWRFNPGPIWLAFRTDYQHASNVGQFVEFYMTAPSGKYLGPGAGRGAPHWYGEGLIPRIGDFFLQPNVWTRAWLYVEDYDTATCFLSLWAADEARDPVQLYDRLPYLPLPDGLKTFQIEFDTSGDQAPNGAVRHAWTRNYAVLKDIVRADVIPLLQRPRH